MKNTLKKVAAILKPGTLAQKYEQISLFFAEGESMLYSGQVAWKMSLPSAERSFGGDAENLDEAFLQIKRRLEDIMKHTPPAEKVALSVEEKDRAAG